MNWRESKGVRWLEADLPGARAAFSTRIGGVSEAPYDTLNVGLLTGDERDRVLENRARLAAALELDVEGLLMGRQVHGGELGPGPKEADGQVTDQAGLAPLVLVADCLPIALAGPERAAMIHCGWRGLAAGIVGGGVRAVDATAAAIGPGIGPCCYEVGEDVLEAFAHLGDGFANGRMLDLTEVARRLLDTAGVTKVEAAECCTSCNPDLFYSHRRDDGRTGRQAGIAWLQG